MDQTLEQLLFPDADAVTAFITQLFASKDQINNVDLSDPHASEIIRTNKDYIAQGLSYGPVINSGADLSSLLEVIA